MSRGHERREIAKETARWILSLTWDVLSTAMSWEALNSPFPFHLSFPFPNPLSSTSCFTFLACCPFDVSQRILTFKPFLREWQACLQLGLDPAEPARALQAHKQVERPLQRE